MPLNGLELNTICFSVNGIRFDVPSGYSVEEPIGQGTYGLVCAARDETTGEYVAIKKIENPFEHLTFTKRTLRELRLLRNLRHENLIDVRAIFMTGEKENFSDIYVVLELMETDLASIIKSPQPVSDDHNQFFLYQILRGMKYIHSAMVIHRDLKPRNLLVNANCDLKIADFGLARVGFSSQDYAAFPMTEYVCTRWYRAPEVLCSWAHYTVAIDIWSIGCIFAEMIGRRPLFPGNKTQHQLTLIITQLGTPSPNELDKIPNQKCRNYLETMGYAPGTPFAEVFPGVSPPIIDLLERMLKFDPDRRIPVHEALYHPYMQRLQCSEDEPVRGQLDTTEFEFERRKIDMKALREELFLETLHYYPEKRERYMFEQQRLGPQRYNIFNYRLLNPGEPFYSDEDD